jgi:hypothetical protein
MNQQIVFNLKPEDAFLVSWNARRGPALRQTMRSCARSEGPISNTKAVHEHHGSGVSSSAHETKIVMAYDIEMARLPRNRF